MAPSVLTIADAKKSRANAEKAKLREALEDRIDATSVAYRRMQPHWPRLQALDEGEDRIKAEAETWVPQWEKESDRNWRARVDNACLFNQYRSTIGRLAREVFSKGVTPEPALPPELQPTMKSADQRGTPLHAFAHAWLRSSIKYGLAGVFVDYPRVDVRMSIAEAELRQIYPYLCLVEAPELINFDFVADVAGIPRLTSVTIRKPVVVRVGKYGQREVDTIRVFRAPTGPTTDATAAEPVRLAASLWLPRFLAGQLTAEQFVKGGGVLGTWERWERDDDEDGQTTSGETEWRMVATGTHTYPGVPLVMHYTNRVGFMEALPHHEALAQANIAHFRSDADQRYALSLARVPTPTGTGVDQDTKDDGLVLGSRKSLLATNSEARFGYLELMGDSLPAGERDLDDLEQRMETYGATPAINRRQGTLATGQLLDRQHQVADLRSWATDLEAALVDVLNVQARWINSGKLGTVTVPKEQRLRVNRDLQVPLPEGGAGGVPEKLFDRGLLTGARTVQEYQRRGEIVEDLDAEEEVDAAQEEAQERALLGPPPGFGADPEQGGQPGEEQPAGEAAQDEPAAETAAGE